jgi:cation transport ATPase
MASKTTISKERKKESKRREWETKRVTQREKERNKERDREKREREKQREWQTQQERETKRVTDTGERNKERWVSKQREREEQRDRWGDLVRQGTMMMIMGTMRSGAVRLLYVKGIIILQVTVSLLWCAAFFAAKALDCTVHVGAYSVFVVSTISTYSEYLSNK